MKKIFKFLPVYGIIPLVGTVLVQEFLYLFTALVTRDAVKYDLTTVFDLHVPFSAWWILFYYGWMLFIAVFYVLVDVYSKRATYRLVTISLISYAILFVFYLAFPTTNVRLPEYRDDGFFGIFVKLLYSMDRPQNLFPSLHVFISWVVFIAFRSEKNVPLWIKLLILNLAICITISTQVLKQHYIVDAISAILFAEILNLVVRVFHLDQYFERFFTFVNVKLRLEPPETYEPFKTKKVRKSKTRKEIE